jgi:hypothetical protein
VADPLSSVNPLSIDIPDRLPLSAGLALDVQIAGFVSNVVALDDRPNSRLPLLKVVEP